MIERFAASEVAIPRGEALRYLGYGGVAPDGPVAALLEDCLTEFAAAAAYRAVRIRLAVTLDSDRVDFGAFSARSAQLARTLDGCREALLFVATVGAGPDRLTARYRRTQPSRAMVLDAIGSAAAEAWCNALSARWRDEFAAEGLRLRPRFSPGYGDFPLAVQPALLGVLDAARRIGVTLTASTMMLPWKSVSAVIGLGRTGCPEPEQDCDRCQKRDCTFRR